MTNIKIPSKPKAYISKISVEKMMKLRKIIIQQTFDDEVLNKFTYTGAINKAIDFYIANKQNILNEKK